MDLSSGRVGQKQRTRRALLAATRDLLQRKAEVSVAAAADAAEISRATAYRYFSTTDTLMQEALLDANWSTPEEVVGDAVTIPERVERVHRFLFSFTRQNESSHRMLVAKALESWVVEGGHPKTQLRGARRLPMFAYALGPVRQKLKPKDFNQLVAALAAASGIEAYIALKDVCGLSDAEADTVSSKTLNAILDSTLGPSHLARRG